MQEREEEEEEGGEGREPLWEGELCWLGLCFCCLWVRLDKGEAIGREWKKVRGCQFPEVENKVLLAFVGVVALKHSCYCLLQTSHEGCGMFAKVAVATLSACAVVVVVEGE